MLHALQRYSDSCEFSIEIVDVDADEALVQQFDELVPVLYGQRDSLPLVQLCHYFLDAQKIEQFLTR
jgi:hypothetical protein